MAPFAVLLVMLAFLMGAWSWLRQAPHTRGLILLVWCLITLGAMVLTVSAEVRRHKVARSGGRGDADTFHQHAAIAIATIAIAAALAAYNASTAFELQSSLAETRSSREADRAAAVDVRESEIDFGARLSVEYASHHDAARELQRFANAAERNGDPDRADQLDAEARVEDAMARSLRSGFLDIYQPSSAGGRVTYQTRRVRAIWAALYPAPGDHARLSGRWHRAHSAMLAFLWAGLLLILALVFLTVAHVAPPRLRLPWSSVAAVLLVCGLTLSLGAFFTGWSAM